MTEKKPAVQRLQDEIFVFLKSRHSEAVIEKRQSVTGAPILHVELGPAPGESVNILLSRAMNR